MENKATRDNDDFQIRAGQSFEGSRPGKGTALAIVIAIAGIALYSFWPSIGHALHVS